VFYCHHRFQNILIAIAVHRNFPPSTASGCLGPAMLLDIIRTCAAIKAEVAPPLPTTEFRAKNTVFRV